MFFFESGKPGQPTIVFLHGNGASSAMWKTHIKHFNDYHCIAVDFPGFGKSNHENWISIDRTANQVIEIVRNRTNHGKAHVIGLSLGGSIAITILGKAPEIIDHAIVDGSGVLPLPGLPFLKIGLRIIQPFLHTNYVIRKIADSMKIHEDDYEGFKQEMLLMSPKSFTRSFLQAMAVRQPSGLEKLSYPVLFVSGEREPNAVKRSNILLAKLMRNGQSRIVPGSGHGWLAEKTDLHIRMVEAWINDQPLPQELIPAHQV